MHRVKSLICALPGILVNAASRAASTIDNAGGTGSTWHAQITCWLVVYIAEVEEREREDQVDITKMADGLTRGKAYVERIDP